jgi:hypothetical protein
MNLLRKIVILKEFERIQQRHPRGQLKYALEFIRTRLFRFVKQGDVAHYCDQRRNQDTHGEKPNFKDNSRQLEKLRTELYPHMWQEVTKSGELYFKFDPFQKLHIDTTIVSEHRKDGFSKDIIQTQLKISNYRCEITGVSGILAADHFIPKEKGGLSTSANCVILHKLLNEHKNKHMPIEWFCESLLTNFMNICRRVGLLEECKQKLIRFIESY